MVVRLVICFGAVVGWPHWGFWSVLLHCGFEAVLKTAVHDLHFAAVNLPFLMLTCGSWVIRVS